MDFSNCFAYPDAAKEKKECSVLKEFLCQTRHKCPFYKTKQQYENDIKKYGSVIESED